MRGSRARLALLLALAASGAAAQVPPPRPAPVGPPVRLSPERPGGEDGVRIDTLAPPDPAWAGTLRPTDGALPVSMWTGTSREFLAAVLPRLQPVASPAHAALARRLLLSGAAPPAGSEPLGALRADRLAAFGLGGAPAAQRGDDEASRRQSIETALVAGDRDAACREVQEGIARFEGVWWDRALITCQALAGEAAKASLGLSLLREQKAPRDAAFDALVEALTTRSTKPVPLPPEPNAFHIALAARAGRGAGAAESAPRLAHPAAARAAALDVTLSAERRIAAGERAATFGLLPADELRALYAQSVVSEGGDPITRAKAEKDGGKARALLLTAAAAVTPSARIVPLALFFQRPPETGGLALAARLAEPLLRDVPATGSLSSFAPDAARALLLLGRADEARAWIAVADPAMARRLYPLARLTGGPAWDADAIRGFAQAAAGDGEAAALRAAGLLSLLAAVGDPVGPAAWAPLVPALTKAEAVTLPPTPIRVALEQAGASRRLGESILLALVALDENGRLPREAARAAPAIEALRRAGLDVEARGLALETALLLGF